MLPVKPNYLQDPSNYKFRRTMPHQQPIRSFSFREQPSRWLSIFDAVLVLIVLAYLGYLVML